MAAVSPWTTGETPQTQRSHCTISQGTDWHRERKARHKRCNDETNAERSTNVLEHVRSLLNPMEILKDLEDS